MKIYQSTRIRTVFLLTMLVAIFMGCSKKKERVYELLPPDPETELDITELAIVFSAKYENNGGANASESSRRLVDNDISTKYLINPYHADMWVQQEFDIPDRVDAYTLTSGNDAPDRDPKSWTLAASHDLNTWVTLDEQTDVVFSDRRQTKRYEFTNTEKFKYYRLSITANNGGSLFQCSEWRIIRRPLP